MKSVSKIMKFVLHVSKLTLPPPLLFIVSFYSIQAFYTDVFMFEPHKYAVGHWPNGDRIYTT